MVKILIKIFCDYTCDDWEVTKKIEGVNTFYFYYQNYDYIETEISKN